MDGSKTNIWRDGIVDLLPQGVLQGDELPPPPVIIRSAAGPLRSLIAVPAASELQSTRIMPIERLLPERKPVRLDLDAESARPAQRRWSARLWQYPLLALVTLLLVAAVMLPPLLRGRGPTLRTAAPRAARAAEPVIEPVVAADGVSAEHESAVPATPLRRPSVADSKLERQAVDALIAGDDARAQRLYAQLAHMKDARPAFSAAERVLAARLAGKR